MKRKAAVKPVAKEPIPPKEISGIYQRVREILESARSGVARTVNTTQVVANWLIGREIIEEEQRGKERADYGERLIAKLSAKLLAEFGPGYAVRNLASFREFYREYPALIEISHALRANLSLPTATVGILHAPGARSQRHRDEAWQPGRLSPNLSWTHYRTLLRVQKSDARAFYEIEAIKNNWSARELERQINSLLFERLAKSRRYLPDFIVLVDDGHGPDDLLHLIVEIKGYRGEDAKEKASTMNTYWIPGVNHLGSHGRWAFAEFCDIYEIESDFSEKVEGQFDQMIAKTTGTEFVPA